MAVTRFSPGVRPPRDMLCTIRTDGRLAFNAEASRALFHSHLRHISLSADPQRIVIQPARANSPHAYLITYTWPGLNSIQVRASIEAAPLFDWVGFDRTRASRVPVQQTGHVFTLDLTQRTQL